MQRAQCPSTQRELGNNRNLPRSRCSIGGENMSFWDWNLDGDEDHMDDVLEFEILNGEFDEDAEEED